MAKTKGRYVDGFVLVVPKRNVAAYRKLAKKASKVWLEHGALEFRECVGDHFDTGVGVPFPRLAKTKPNETVFFSWITYTSRKHRDRVNAAVMKDPRISGMDEKAMPFDSKRMAWGGFKVVVSEG